MSATKDNNETYKLSEIISENQEIISDVNDLIGKVNDNPDAIDNDTRLKYIDQLKELRLDIEDIIEVIECCKRENDPSLKSFDEDKKSEKIKAQKSMKLIDENIGKLERLSKKTEKENSKKEKASKKDKNKNKSVKEDLVTDEQKPDSASLKSQKNDETKEPSSKVEISDSINETKSQDDISNSSKKSKSKKKKKKDEKDEKTEEKPDESEKTEKTEKTETTEKTDKKEKKDKKAKKEKKEKDQDKVSSNDSELLSKSSNKTTSKKKGILKKSKSKESINKENDTDQKSVEDKESLKGDTLGEQAYNKDYDEIDSENSDLKSHVSDTAAKHENNVNEISESSSKGLKRNEAETGDAKVTHIDNKEKKSTDEKDKTKKLKVKKDKKSDKSSKEKDKEDKKNNVNVEKSPEKETSKVNDKPEEHKQSTSSDTSKPKKQISNAAPEHTELLIPQTKTEKLQSMAEVTQSSNNLNINEKGDVHIVTKDFSAEQDGDLSCTMGEEILILDKDEEDFWFAKNSKGVTGYVPKECVEPKTQVLDKKDGSPQKSEIQSPSKDHDVIDDIQNDEESNLLYQMTRPMHEKPISELLKSIGNMPTGFRYSTLSKWSQNDTYKSNLIAYFHPQLSESNLSFCDLPSNQIRPQQVKIQRQIQINKVIQFPQISDKFVVKSRHVRMCLFDGVKAVSNIHIMRATINEKDLKTWIFNSKVNDWTKSLEYNDVFIRFNQSSTDISVLMEFCMLGFKSKLNATGNASGVKIEEDFTDEELVELSVGWITVPLYDVNCQPINNKKGDYPLNGGSPFEKGIEVDPIENKTDNTNVVCAPEFCYGGSKSNFFGSQNKQPLASIKIYIPSKENKDLLETLPSMIIGSSLNLTILSFYRRILAEKILDHRNDLTSTKPIYSPFLVSFTEASRYTDVLDMLRTIWNERLKVTKSVNKKDYGKMNEFFEKVYMDYVYPLMKLSNLPPVNLARQNLEQSRVNMMREFSQRAKEDFVSVLLTDEFSYSPFEFEEVNFRLAPTCVKLKQG